MNFSAVANFANKVFCSSWTLSNLAFDSSNSFCNFLWVPDTASNFFSNSSFFCIAAAAVAAACWDFFIRGSTISYNLL